MDITYHWMPVWTATAPTHETADGAMIAARRASAHSRLNRQADEAVRAAIQQGKRVGAIDDVNEGTVANALYAVMRG